MMIGEVDEEAFAEASGVTVRELEDSGLLPLPATLSRGNMRVVESIGDPTQVISDLVERC
jgi:hypothetical protein